MKDDRVLVTGGAGFIGRHVTDALAERGKEVLVVDSFEPQAHEGSISSRQLPKGVTLVNRRLSDAPLKALLADVDSVIHLAAVVGVGQSMYQIREYVEKNTADTAALLDAIANADHNLRKLVVASSMSVYGEGQYYCERCDSARFPSQRSSLDLNEARWDPRCEQCEGPMSPVATKEDKPLVPSSIYAMSKRDQEEMCLLIGKTYGLPTVALRFFNTYGPNQSLSNPYTGACAIFASRILGGKSPFIFEDGKQLRDFVHVRDVVRCVLMALERSTADFQAINVGTGNPVSILSMAHLLGDILHSDLSPHVSNKARKGDIRHCYPDVDRARKTLDFKPEIELKDGLVDFANWIKRNQLAVADSFDRGLKELQDRHLA